MRQVPAKYLIIGRGRLASHLANYFQLLKIPYSVWTREQSLSALKSAVSASKRILIAIKDDAIESFIQENGIPAEKAVHFSGTLSTPLAIRLHPLMTFTNSMYELEDYKKIPFVGEVGSPTLQNLIPELVNPYYVIPKSSQDLYHALCVMSGNGTVVLWQQVLEVFADRLQLPKEVLTPYLQRIVKNLAADPQNALTGPWVRGDIATIDKNQAALKNTPLLNLYLSLLNTYNATRSSRPSELRSSP